MLKPIVVAMIAATTFVAPQAQAGAIPAISFPNLVFPGDFGGGSDPVAPISQNN